MEPGWAVAGGLDLDESFTSIKQKASDAELNRLTLDENLDEVTITSIVHNVCLWLLEWLLQ